MLFSYRKYHGPVPNRYQYSVWLSKPALKLKSPLPVQRIGFLTGSARKGWRAWTLDGERASGQVFTHRRDAADALLERFRKDRPDLLRYAMTAIQFGRLG